MLNIEQLSKSCLKISKIINQDEDVEKSELSRLLLKPYISPNMQPYSYSPPSSQTYARVNAFELVLANPIPEVIKNAISKAECEVQMGIFPEICRAWFTVDNVVYLWNYYEKDSQVVSTYSKLDQLIISVGLARPLMEEALPLYSTSGSNVSVAPPDFFLVVCTIMQVLLLRIDFQKPAQANVSPLMGAIQLNETKISCLTDGIPMRVVKGTSEGRIFLAGNDGNLHEFVYEKPNVFHSLGVKRQCFTIDHSKHALSSAMSYVVPSFIKTVASNLLNALPDPLIQMEIDHARKLLYTLSKNNVLTMYSFKPSGGDHGMSQTGNSASSSSSAAAVAAGLSDQQPRNAQSLTLITKIDNFANSIKQFIDNKPANCVILGVQKQDFQTFQVSSISIIPSQTAFVHLVIVSTKGM